MSCLYPIIELTNYEKASIAAGWWYGLAKKADVIIVPLPYKDTKKEKYVVKAEVFLQMTLLVQDDIRHEQDSDTLYAPVVLIPREFDRPNRGTVQEYETNKLLGKSTTKKVIEALRGLVALHAAIVTGAGNWNVSIKLQELLVHTCMLTKGIP